MTIYIHIACQGIAALAMNFKEIRLANECTSFSRSILKNYRPIRKQLVLIIL